MANNRIRGNQVKTPATITQNEHEDAADARRVVPVDEGGEFFGTPGNPINVTAGLASASNPVIYNVECPIADTEYSQLLPDNTKQFLIKVRDGGAIMKVAFVENESDVNYFTIHPGANHLQLDVAIDSKTIYFQLNQPGKVVEILAWY